MSLVAKDLANAIKAKNEGLTDPGAAITAFWDAIKEYVEKNAEVIYTWSAVDSTSSPDPTTTWTGRIITSGSLSPSGKDTAAGALSKTSEDMNVNVNEWTIKPPSDFSVSGPTIKGSSISMKASGATDRDSALLAISEDIIEGIKAAIPPIMSGSHGSYTGATTGGKII